MNDKTKMSDINESITDNNYTISYTDYKQLETTIYGIILNFTTSNVVIYVEDGIKQGLYIIPYKWINYMKPNGLSRQYKEKIKDKEEKEFEIVSPFCKKECKICYGKYFCSSSGCF